MNKIMFDIDNKSSEIELSNNNLTATKNSGSYGGVLANISKDKGKWYWEVSIDICDPSMYFSSNMLIGVCESNQKISSFNSCNGFTNVRMIYDIGSKIESNNYIKYGKPFKTGDIVGILLDLNLGTIGFSINGEYQGIAFDNLKGKSWYPCVFAYSGQKWTINFGNMKLKYKVNGYNTLISKIKCLVTQKNAYFSLLDKYYDKSMYYPLLLDSFDKAFNEGFEDPNILLQKVKVGNGESQNIGLFDEPVKLLIYKEE